MKATSVVADDGHVGQRILDQRFPPVPDLGRPLFVGQHHAQRVEGFVGHVGALASAKAVVEHSGQRAVQRGVVGEVVHASFYAGRDMPRRVRGL